MHNAAPSILNSLTQHPNNAPNYVHVDNTPQAILPQNLTAPYRSFYKLPNQSPMGIPPLQNYGDVDLTPHINNLVNNFGFGVQNQLPPSVWHPDIQSIIQST